MLFILQGEVECTRADGCTAGVVGAGQSLGEVALLTNSARSTTATARAEVHAGVISRDDLNALVRQRPDIGVVLYRNLAERIGSRLHQIDLDHSDD